MQIPIDLLKLLGWIMLGPTPVGILSVTVREGILALPAITVRVFINVHRRIIIWRNIIVFELTR